MITNQNLITAGWPDYKLVDSGDYQKLERFGQYYVIRPCKQAHWAPSSLQAWQQAQAVFDPQHGWQLKTVFPEKWQINWQDLTFNLALHPFGHLGIFPEQSQHWQWLKDQFQQLSQTQRKETRVLNLFAYTGAASLVCAQAGVQITHVDSSASAIKTAKDNQRASQLDERSVRWIFDDVKKFVAREIKRGKQYDAIMLDPPAFGHGKKGEKWIFKRDFPLLLDACLQILSQQPLFILINSYALQLEAGQLQAMVEPILQNHHLSFKLTTGELALKAVALTAGHPQVLSTGVWLRVEVN